MVAWCLRLSRVIRGRPGWTGGILPTTAETIGRAAADAGLVLLELRPAGGGGLEQMFLTLTAGDSVKESVR